MRESGEEVNSMTITVRKLEKKKTTAPEPIDVWKESKINCL